MRRTPRKPINQKKVQTPQSSSSSSSHSSPSSRSSSPSKSSSNQSQPQSNPKLQPQQQEKKQPMKEPAPAPEHFHKLSPTLQNSYTRIKQSEQSSSLILTQQTTKVLIHLKQLYLLQQSAIVKGIKQMSQVSKNIIQDLNNIELQIDNYQQHLEHWIKKIQQSAPIVDKIINVEPSFKKKAINFAKLKDYLNVERPKRR